MSPAQASIETKEDVTVGKAAASDWIVERTATTEVPAHRAAGVSDGIFYTLADTQVAWRPDGYEYYNRFAYTVTDRSGLEEASRLTYAFDPHDTVLTFNHIRVIRNGEVLDRLADLEITLLRQEEGLESAGIIDGQLTALAELEDIQVGDTIDYAVSSLVTSDLWPGEFFDYFDMGWSDPVGARHYKLIWPADKPLYIKDYEGAPAPIVTSAGASKVYEWSVVDPDSVPGEESTPIWHITWPLVSVSSMESWEDVQRWAAPKYDVDMTLPDAFKAQVKTIADQWQAPEDRLTEALRLVQDKIRYVGIEIGNGSHVPRTPQQVIRRGYGDCKDKAMLLTAVLRELGISAWPALVESDEGPGLPDMLPAPIAFDHAITKAQIGDKAYWLDPTLSHQGGRGDMLIQPSYAYGLPIGAEDAGLEPIAVQPTTAPTLQVTESYFFPAKGVNFFTLTVTAVYEEDEADIQRGSIASQSYDEFSGSYFDYYQGMYDGIEESTKLTIEDDMDANRVTITVGYSFSRVKARTAGAMKSMPIRAWGVRDLFNVPNQTSRRTPLEMPYRINRHHQIKLTVEGRRPKGSDVVIRSVEDATFKRTFTENHETLLIDFEVKNNMLSVAADDAADAIKFGNDLAGHTNLTFKIDNVPLSMAGRFNIDEELFAPIEEDMTKALRAMDDDKNIQALRTLNAMLKQVPEANRLRGLIQLKRGMVLNKLDRDSFALKAFEEAADLYADDANLYFRMAELYRGAEDLEKEVGVLLTLAAKHPQSAKNLNSEWVGDLNFKLTEVGKTELFDNLAILLAGAGYEGSNSWGADWIYATAVQALVETDRLSNVSRFLDQISDPQSLLSLMVDRRYEVIWPDVEKRAGADLRIALDREIENRKKAYEEDDEDVERLTAYIEALRAGGKIKEAAAVAKPFFEDWGTVEAIGTDAFWAVNSYAFALNDLGRYDESIDVLKKMADLPIEDFPDTISMRINLAIMLQRVGRYEEALTYAEELGAEVANDYASEYGRMFIKSVQACSRYMLGRTDEAAPILANMAEDPRKNIHAYQATLLCADKPGETADLIVSNLEDASYRDEALSKFLQAKEAPKTPPFERVMMNRLRKALALPKAQEAFAKNGRQVKIDAYDLHWGG